MPDNLSYLILGLVVTAVIMGAFIATLIIRHRNLEQDLKLIEQLSQEDS
jgi:uncharacterized membrane protein YciS (DUF1049 family)